jgi:hypothetical protein
MPEEEARQQIDQRLGTAGWQIQEPAKLNLAAQPAVASRGFSTTTDINRLECRLFLRAPSGSTPHLNFN